MEFRWSTFGKENRAEYREALLWRFQEIISTVNLSDAKRGCIVRSEVGQYPSAYNSPLKAGARKAGVLTWYTEHQLS
jgi:hypothetical protein